MSLTRQKELLDEIDKFITEIDHSITNIKNYDIAADRIIAEIKDHNTALHNLSSILVNLKVAISNAQYQQAIELLKKVKFDYHNQPEGKEWMRSKGHFIRDDKIKIYYLSEEFYELKSKWNKDLKALSKEFPEKKLTSSKVGLYSADSSSLPPSESFVAPMGSDSVKLTDQKLKEPLLGDDESSSPSSKGGKKK